MARIDPLIESLLCEEGTELVFETGAAARLALKAGVVTPIRKVLGTQQIRTFIAELATGATAENVRSGTSPVSFRYRHPKGTVLVDVQPEGDRLVVRVVPAPPGAAGEETEPEPAAEPAAAPGTAAAPEPARAPLVPPAAATPARPPAEPRGAPPRLARPERGERGGRRARLRARAVEEEALDEEEEPPRRPARRARAQEIEYDEHELEHDDASVIVLPGPSAPLDPDRASPAAKAMDALLEGMLAKNASDLHLTTGYLPCFRIDGDVVPVEGASPLSLETLTAMIYSLMPQRNRKEFEKRNDTDFAHETPASRFRVNVFRDRMGIGSVIRQIPNKIRSAEELGLAKAIVDLCSLPKGLVLVTGPTGSGKSTTLAAMIDHVNRSRTDHIITIEDPVEFVHPHKKCVVHQREVHVHTESFKSALRAALREDPDVVLVGEMRDLETVAIAIETAETGHLVFGTLHTNTAPSTVDRIIDQFPADRQAQIRVMLSETLKAVITQTLVKKRGGGRLAVHEILIVNPAVSNLIREGKTFQIPSMMQTGRNLGMVTQTDALFELVRTGKVDAAEAITKAAAKGDLKSMLEKAGLA